LGPDVAGTTDEGQGFVFRYEDILRAVGRFIDEHDLQDVVVLQLDEGVLVRGLTTTFERNRAGKEFIQHLFTQDELIQIDEKARNRRGQGSRLFR
jgi:hypothetical protein